MLCESGLDQPPNRAPNVVIRQHGFPIVLQGQARSAHQRTSKVVPTARSKWMTPECGPTPKASTAQTISETRATSNVMDMHEPRRGRLTVPQGLPILNPSER